MFSLSSGSGQTAWLVLGCSHSPWESPLLCSQAWSPKPSDILRHGEWGNLSISKSTEPPIYQRAWGFLKVRPTQARNVSPVLGLQSGRGDAEWHRRAVRRVGGISTPPVLPLPQQPPAQAFPAPPNSCLRPRAVLDAAEWEFQQAWGPQRFGGRMCEAQVPPPCHPLQKHQPVSSLQPCSEPLPTPACCVGQQIQDPLTHVHALTCTSVHTRTHTRTCTPFSPTLSTPESHIPTHLLATRGPYMATLQPGGLCISWKRGWWNWVGLGAHGGDSKLATSTGARQQTFQGTASTQQRQLCHRSALVTRLVTSSGVLWDTGGPRGGPAPAGLTWPKDPAWARGSGLHAPMAEASVI